MTEVIAWALVHFLWQGTVLALIAALLMRLSSSSSVRYLIGVSTLAAMVMAVLVTTLVVPSPTVSAVQGSTASSGLEVFPPTVMPADGVGTTGAEVRVFPATWIVGAWLIGVVVLSVRAMGGWWVARRVARQALTPLSDELQSVAAALAQRLGVRRVIGVYASSRVPVPMMIGWLRPIVLMPPAALAGLSVAQIESIFAHEFAHIRRHDYLVNLLQTAVETVLFFHPAVWWVSRQIRRERELCCDDLAVSVSDRLTYATALSALAHLHPPSLALAATDGSLRDRVRRIITNSSSSESAKGGWMAMLPLVLVVSLAAPSAFSQVAAVPPTEIPVVQKTAPAKPKEVVAVAPTVITAGKGIVHLKTPNAEVEAKRIELQSVSQDKVEVQQLFDEQFALERKRLELAKDRAENDSALNLRKLEIEVQNGQLQIDEIRKKVAAGIEGEGRLRSFESTQKLAVAKLEAERRALDLTLMDLALQQEELELRRRMQKVGIAQATERPKEVSPEGKRLWGAEAVRPGDSVTIVIEGSTEGPATFTVDAHGSVQHPQLGAIIVGDHSTSGIREKIVKLLVAKGLATNPTVTVTATRR